ncbi:unnamed protein product [Agarophyton chilense]
MHAADTPAPKQPLSERDVRDAATRLARSPMFHRCDPPQLLELARRMQKLVFRRGDLIVTQNRPADRMLVLADGYVRRLATGPDGVERQLHAVDANTVAELQVTAAAPLNASAKCVTHSCTAYAISRDAFRSHLNRTPHLSTQVIESLSDHVLSNPRRFRTPLMSQRANEINLSAVAVASVVESYYRSALNAILNRRLSGISAPLFPNMHVQVPARVLYITGFKSLRAILDRDIDPDAYQTHPARVAVRFCKTIAPGVIMTPISSILEASNVGHVNSQPLLRRSLHGSVPRLAREVVFGVGLNQLSDYMEERYRSVAPNALAANMAGSLTAGVVAGYLSHVPHNLSTYRLLNPHKSYSELFELFVNKSVPEHLIPNALPPSVVPFTKTLLACLLPRGVLIRTVQICGSFAILNGIISLIEAESRNRVARVIESVTEETAAEEGVKVARSQSE